MSALRLMALADAIKKAIPHGQAAIAAAIAGSDAVLLVAKSEPRLGRDGSICWVVVSLATTSTATIDDWSKSESARAGKLVFPPPPQLMSPSNVPPEAWGELPVYFDFTQPWGRVSCECAHGDSSKRIRSFIVKPTPLTVR